MAYNFITPPNSPSDFDSRLLYPQTSGTYDIIKFIQDYQCILCPTDVIMLQDLNKKIQELRRKPMIVNRNGHHYLECTLSNENEQNCLQTCQCVIENVQTEERKARNMMNFYKFIYGLMS